MLVENYINELKKNKENEKIKKIVKEYNKEVEFKLNGPIMKKPADIYLFSILSLIGSLIPLILRDENISLVISLIYTIPLLTLSIVPMILLRSLKKCKCVNIKLFLALANSIILEFIVMCFTGTYMFQFILFNWTTIDYLKIIMLLMFLITLVIIIGIRNAPKKFINQYSKKNIYKNPSEAAIKIGVSLGLIANITKANMLILVAFYSAIIYFIPFFIFLVYKAKKYDYIQSLLKEEV
ncbi:MAG: hypothetical protein IJO26_00575 [Clostridium sp.]|nr:hypothetical protein [Clostridium sp.]